jgi:hypothetical protein
MRLALLMFVCGIATTLHAQELSDTDVVAAIKAGESKKFDDLVSDCVATPGFGENLNAGLAGGVQRNGSYNVTVAGNTGRIAYLAADAKRLYKPLTLDAVPEDLRRPAVIVMVEPQKPSSSSNTIAVAAPIDHVVLKSKIKSDVVIQPLKVDTEPVSWSNLLGGKVEANRAVAWFNSSEVRELPAGDFDVVVITSNGERRCKVGTKDRAKLFSAQR